MVEKCLCNSNHSRTSGEKENEDGPKHLSNVPFHWPWHIDKGEKMVRNEEGGGGIYV